MNLNIYTKYVTAINPSPTEHTLICSYMYTVIRLLHCINKSTQRVHTFLAEADHNQRIAWIPDLESQQISIWKSDKETCTQTYLVC